MDPLLALSNPSFQLMTGRTALVLSNGEIFASVCVDGFHSKKRCAEFCATTVNEENVVPLRELGTQNKFCIRTMISNTYGIQNPSQDFADLLVFIALEAN
jgi:hypothetical protein